MAGFLAILPWLLGGLGAGAAVGEHIKGKKDPKKISTFNPEQEKLMKLIMPMLMESVSKHGLQKRPVSWYDYTAGKREPYYEKGQYASLPSFLRGGG